MVGNKTSHDDIFRVIECHKIGLQTKEISIQTGVRPRTIHNLVAKFKAGGSVTLPEHRKAMGHDFKLPERSLKFLKLQA